MKQVTLKLPETVFAALGKDPEKFGREMRLAAAVKWYELGLISQEKAAEIAGLSRCAFIMALGRFRVSVLQIDEAQLREELEDAD